MIGCPSKQTIRAIDLDYTIFYNVIVIVGTFDTLDVLLLRYCISGRLVAISYPTSKRLRLHDLFNSSATLLKFVECCCEIEEVSFDSDDIVLTRSDIEAIASLPRLKSLNTNCRITDDAVSVLSRCKGLKLLTLGWVSFDLNNIIPTIGRNLASLDYSSSKSILETASLIVDNWDRVKSKGTKSLFGQFKVFSDSNREFSCASFEPKISYKKR
jgi:hypothetical protein